MTLECLPGDVQDSLSCFTAGRCSSFVRKVADSELGTAYTVEISDAVKPLSLFIKCLHETEATLSEGRVYFNNEVVFYGKILRDFLRLQEQHRGRINIPFTSVPKCISAGFGEVPFIILDNLVSLGYKALDVKEPLSIENARLVLQQLGRFHAFSFALKDKNSDSFQNATSKLQETTFTPKMRPIFLHGIHDALKLAKQSLPKNSVYVEKFSIFTLNVFESLSKLISEDDDGFFVVTHGDLWANNILCRFDEVTGFPQDAAFIDFQACRLSSPVHDLMFILLLAVDKRTRDEFHDELLLCYHSSLCEKLLELGSDPLRLFPFSALHSQLGKHTRFVLAMGLAGLPLYMNEGSISPTEKHNDSNDSAGSLAEYVQSVSAMKTMKCKNKMLEIIMDCIDQGYLD